MAERREGLPQLDLDSLPGPEDIRRETWENGIVALARANFASPSVVIRGYLQAGSSQEPPGQAGMADLTVSSLMRGTGERSFAEIYESIESIGANLEVGAGKHTTSFQGKGLAEDLGLLLDLLAEVLRDPSFPSENVERLRSQKLTAIALRDQDTGARAQMAFNRLAYPDHPYSVPTRGFADTVSELKLSQLRRFHREQLGPRGMVIAIVGAVPPGEALEAARARLEDWRNPQQAEHQPVASVDRPQGLLREEVHIPGKSQCDLVLGWPGPSRYEEDYLAAALGNSILGRFGMYGRIGDRVREAAGLAYYSYSSLSGGPGPGAWEVIAGVNPANVEQAIELIRQEVRDFVAEPVSQEELADNQANFIGRLPLQLESNEGVAGALLHAERYELGLDYYRRYPGIIAAIDPGQVLEAARRFLDPDNLVLGVAGPVGEGG